MILNKDITKLSTTNNKVNFSDKVYIDFSNIFKTADKDTKGVILDYLLTISALVDPTAKAKDILKKDEKSKESDFLSSMIEKVEENVNVDSNNPLEAVSSIMNSGIFTELLSNMNNGLQDGSLDLSKLLGSVQGMVTKLSNKGGDNNDNDSLNMINNMVGMLGKQNGEGGNNMTDLMAMMGPMLATLNTAMPADSGAVQPQLPDIMNMMSNLNNKSKFEQLE